MTAKSQPSNGSALAGCVLILFIIGIVIYSCSTDSGGSDSTEPDDGGGGSMAEVMCENFVTDRLKAPSTADFPGADSVDELGSDEYEVTASVDSENGFGAMIRTDYVCTIRYSGDDKWTLVSLDINE